MGSLTKKSQANLALNKRDQQTSTICPKCRGNGQFLRWHDGHQYSLKLCKWCSGQGNVLISVIDAWQRLMRIKEYYIKNNIPFII